MNTKRELTANDILDTDAYIKVRQERRAEILSKKKITQGCCWTICNILF